MAIAICLWAAVTAISNRQAEARKLATFKIGVDAGPLSDIDRKLVEAGALCHLATGLTLAIHTGNGVAALEILINTSAAVTKPSPFTS